jgi:hypothetical protein
MLLGHSYRLHTVGLERYANYIQNILSQKLKDNNKLKIKFARETTYKLNELIGINIFHLINNEHLISLF